MAPLKTMLFVSLLTWGIASPIRSADVVALPRKAAPSPGRDETYAGVTVLYDAIRDGAGNRQRLIATHPNLTCGSPVIYVIGWLSCDTVEAHAGMTDATQLMLRSIATLPGFATVRLEKPGVGDSEGNCATTDFKTELAAYQQAFQHLSSYAFIDTSAIFLFGISNGGGFAPLVADGAAVKGYVIDGGWIKTWYEHMLEIERRRLSLARSRRKRNQSPHEVGGVAL